MSDVSPFDGYPREPLAIVGMGCRLPGGVFDVESFWNLLVERRSGIVEVPETRWNRSHYYHPNNSIPNKMVSKWGGFVDGLEDFDARFWGISPREATRMDPQQRWLLETAWESIEDAGIAPSKLQGTSTSVYVGVASHDFASIQMSEDVKADVHTNSGSTLSIASNRISYLLDLKGPSVSVDTACSSALVAVTLACESIWSGKCQGALAGGVNTLITPHATIGFSRASMLSPSGQCYAFDARANGYVRGEGAGMVYIKPLRQALADGDRIYSVIRAAVINQDGHTSSMTVPGLAGQSAMLHQAYAEAGLPANRVVYMEAHGTGTPVGDPIELSALGQVLSRNRSKDEPCLIGSVKTNIGHLEAGSGIAGLIKAALVLHKDQVPPNQNFETPNPHIPFGKLNLKVATELQPLPRYQGLPPVAAVNSFGFGGTNSHVVLEAAPAEAANRLAKSHDGLFSRNGSSGHGTNGSGKLKAKRPYLLPISARDEVALKNYVVSFAELLNDESLPLSDICYSAGARKEQHIDRLAVFGDSRDSLKQQLHLWLDKSEDALEVVRGKANILPGPPVFVFTGQGVQWWAMGRELLSREPLFQQMIARIDALLEPLSGWSLLEEMLRPEADSKINQTAFAQPAIFALQVALTDLWKSWGIVPAKVVGHSVGEVAAAYCAGIYSLEDAVKVIFHRSRLQDTAAGTGRMLAAGISAAEARRLIGDRIAQVQVAAINSSKLVTLAGDTAPLEAIAADLERSGKFMRWLRVNYAFHSHQMEPIKSDLLAALDDIQPHASRIPFISTVTGGVVAGESLDACYWWRNVRYPVLFSPAVNHLIAGGAELFVEVGPHPALVSSISQCLADQGKKGSVFHSLRRGGDDSKQLLTNLAGLHCYGANVDWAVFCQTPGRLVRLPTYPWHRERYWLSRDEMALPCLVPNDHPLLGRRIIATKPTWEFELEPTQFDYLEDHSFWDTIVFPGAGYGEIGIALARLLFPDEPYVVEDIDIKGALFVSKEKTPTVRVVFDETDKSYSVYSGTGAREDWKLNANGRLVQLSPVELEPANLTALRDSLPDTIGHERFYGEFAASGYQFGPRFQHIQNVWRKPGEALAEIVVPEEIAETVAQYHFHPAVLDACFHIFKGVQQISPGAVPEDYFYLPESIRRIRMYCDKPPTTLYAHAKLIADDGKSLSADIYVYDSLGNRLADILGFRADHVEQKKSADDIGNCYYQFKWQPDNTGNELPDQGLGSAPAEVALNSAAMADVEPPSAALYLVFTDRSGVGASLCRNLAQQGHHAVSLRAGDRFEKLEPDEFSVRVNSLEDLRRVLADDDVSISRLAGIVHCWALDHSSAEAMTQEDLLQAQSTGPLHALRLVHLLEGREFVKSPRVRFVTRNAQPILDADNCGRLASASLIGFARVANNEHPAYRWTVIDLDSVASDREELNLLNEVLESDDEFEVAYRADTRYVNRLVRVQADDLPKRKCNAITGTGKIAYRLQTEKAGILTNLGFHETTRREPGPDEIEVEVKAGGVNFRDVMKALGMYPGNPIDLLWFGDDFAGTIVRVGENVKDLNIGDDVAGMAPYSFRAFTTIDRRMCFRMPAHLSFQEAATLPTVFLTTQYAISYLARMQPGESILIHAGTGGVGQAAIQIAQHLGLKVFATAGNPAKRQMLRDMGVPHVMDSRSLDFADEVMSITKGHGVDAVLNSLAGDFIPKSFSVLAPFGRFLEIGKVDVYGNTKIGLEPLRNNISYFVIDLAQHLEHRPDFIASLFSELSARFESSDYRPLSHKVFPISEVVDAFRFMAQGKHVGKNVLSFEVDELPIGPCTEDGHLFRSEASYLIVGGASGFGLEHAKWMAQQGAKHLVLLSRSGPRDAQAIADIDQLRSIGINVVDARADVTLSVDVQRVIAYIAEKMPPLRGVIHGAMVLDDEFIVELNDERFNKVMHPKLLGAWNLHLATIDAPLEHFVCFSSFSNIVGGAKQSNYNAGNCFLDALAHYRHSLGLPALTYNWTALTGAGFVERNEKTAQYLDKIGMKAFSMDEAFRVYRKMLTRDPVQLGACRADWNALSRFSPMIANSRMFAGVLGEQNDHGSGGMIGSRIIAAAPQDQFVIVESFIADQVAGVFSIDVSRVDREAPLTTLGLDSLMAIDLMNRIESELGVTLAMGSVLSGSSVKDFAKIVLRLVLESTTVASDGDNGESAAIAATAPLEPLSYPDATFSLSVGQLDLWQQYVDSPSDTTLQMACAAKLSSRVDAKMMQEAFERLYDRHPMLRVSFQEDNGHIVQRCDGKFNKCFEVHDKIEGILLGDKLTACLNRQFDLRSGSLVRLDLFPLDKNQTALLLSGHRTAVDRLSLSLILQELLANYAALQSGQTISSLARKLTYQDFVAWQRQRSMGEAGDRSFNYWKDLLKDAPLKFGLPANRDVNKSKRRHTAKSFAFNRDLSQRMVTFAAEQNVPLATVLLTAFQILLHRLTNQSDAVIEHWNHGRTHEDIREVIGPFATSIPVRSRTGDDPSFLELLVRNQEQLQAGQEHQQVSLARLLERFEGRDCAHVADSLRVGFSMIQASGVDELGLMALTLGTEGLTTSVCGSTLQSVDLPHAVVRNSVSLAFQESGGQIFGSWQYDQSQFEAKTIARIHDQLVEFLSESALHPERRVAEFKSLASTTTYGYVHNNGSVNGKSNGQAARKLSRAGRESIQVDFSREATLDSSIVPANQDAYQPSVARQILLTGGTGFVGAFLVCELLRQTEATLHCLVRASDERRALKRLQENLAKYDLAPEAFESRVVAVPGDFAKPFLGLSPERFDKLSGMIDAIYHNGADVNLGAPYLQLRSTNVLGTQEVLRLAAKNKLKPVHFVSTFTVMATDFNRNKVVHEKDPLPPPESLLHGYSQTKWVSESLIHQAQARGIPASIYRPGHVTGHSMTGASNTDDLLHTILLTCWRMGSAPLRSGEMDMTPVDYVAKALVALSLSNECLGGTYHLTNPNPLDHRHLVDWMQREGIGVRAVPYDQWRAELLALTARTPIESLQTLVETMVPDAANYNGVAPPLHPKYDCRQALNALTDADIRCAEVDDRLLKVYLEYSRRTGTFPEKDERSPGPASLVQ